VRRPWLPATDGPEPPARPAEGQEDHGGWFTLPDVWVDEHGNELHVTVDIAGPTPAEMEVWRHWFDQYRTSVPIVVQGEFDEAGTRRLMEALTGDITSAPGLPHYPEKPPPEPVDREKEAEVIDELYAPDKRPCQAEYCDDGTEVTWNAVAGRWMCHECLDRYCGQQAMIVDGVETA
jgi:hypothetical protein